MFSFCLEVLGNLRNFAASIVQYRPKMHSWWLVKRRAFLKEGCRGKGKEGKEKRERADSDSQAPKIICSKYASVHVLPLFPLALSENAITNRQLCIFDFYSVEMLILSIFLLYMKVLFYIAQKLNNKQIKLVSNWNLSYPYLKMKFKQFIEQPSF